MKTLQGLLPLYISRNKLHIDTSENIYLSLWRKKLLNRLNSYIKIEEPLNNNLPVGPLLRKKEERCLLKTRDLNEI